MRIDFLKKSLLVFTLYCLWSNSYSQTKNDFGTRGWIKNALEGKIYALPANTLMLPDFDTMTSLGTIYTKELNIPGRSWTSGFPGVTDRFEWFGIEYNGTFTVRRKGRYTFTLLSDDGSRLYIDDSLVIDNDGVHGPQKKENVFELDASLHKIKIRYFQGPRTQIALQLFAKPDNETQQIFPGDNFILTTPGSSTIFPSYLIWIAGIILILFLILFVRRRKRRSLQPDN
jgi:hypothetical protein